MSYVLSMDQSIANISGYCAEGKAIVGSNGDTGGLPDYYAGADDTNTSYGYLTWDSSTTDGSLDSGSRSFEYDADLSTGTDSLTISGEPLTYSPIATGTIGSIIVRVGTDVTAKVTFSDVMINFYQGGNVVETDAIAGDVAVDTTGSPASPTAEDVATVTPGSASDRVVVSGTFRMACPAGTYPSGSDMFCQVLVNLASTG